MTSEPFFLRVLYTLLPYSVRRKWALGFRHDLQRMIDKQFRIETNTYDSQIGRQAVLAAQHNLDDGLKGVPPTRQWKKAIEILEQLKERQDKVEGKYSSGGATVGSLLQQVKDWGRE